MRSPVVLIRYGAIPEVARFGNPSGLVVARGDDVVVMTHRGTELGTVLDVLRPSAEPRSSSEVPEPSGEVIRVATSEDRLESQRLRDDAAAEFLQWEQRIANWRLDLQLVDLEWTLDRRKLTLYVLNERGPECTRLALQAAAAGLGLIEVQPVSIEGLTPREAGHAGCGSCGCHN